MGGTGRVFVAAPGLSARQIAECFLAGMGVSAAAIMAARYRIAATESPEFAVPPGVDYHDYDCEQGFPAWVRVGVLDEAYRGQILADHEWSPQTTAAMFGATHMISLVYAYSPESDSRVQDAVRDLAQDYPVAWLDDTQALRRS